MIIFNDKKYAANENEFTESLFSPGATCNGFYKKTKNGYRLFNIQHELIAFIRCSKEPMLMNAIYGGMLNDKSKIWYSYTTTATEIYLGFINTPEYSSLTLQREAVDTFIDNYWSVSHA